MKTIIFLLNCLLAFSLTAAEPSKQSAFEVRLVLDSDSPLVLAGASTNSEQMTCIHRGTPSGQTIEEKLIVLKKPLLDGSALKSAAVQKDPVSGAPEVQLTFTEQGAKRFAKATREHLRQRMAVLVDGKICVAPNVMTECWAAVISMPSEQEAAQPISSKTASFDCLEYFRPVLLCHGLC